MTPDLNAMARRWEKDMAELTPAEGEDDWYCFVRESLGKASEDLADATKDEERVA